MSLKPPSAAKPGFIKSGQVLYTGPKARWTTGVGVGVVISTEADPPTATVQWSYTKFPKKQFVHKVPQSHIEVTLGIEIASGIGAGDERSAENGDDAEEECE